MNNPNIDISYIDASSRFESFPPEMYFPGQLETAGGGGEPSGLLGTFHINPGPGAETVFF